MVKWRVFIALVLLVIFIIVMQVDRNELRPGEILQSGNVEISGQLTNSHDVLYEKNFEVLPRVSVKLTAGSANLEIIEQRVDGFIFSASNLGYSVAEGAHVEWVAAGLPKK